MTTISAAMALDIYMNLGRDEQAKVRFVINELGSRLPVYDHEVRAWVQSVCAANIGACPAHKKPR